MGKCKCLVAFCESRGSIPGLIYFRLTQARKALWLQALGRDPNEIISTESRICSLHFSENDIVRKGKRFSLKENSVPTKKLGRRRPLVAIQETSGYEQKTDFNPLSEESKFPESPRPSTSSCNIDETYNSEVQLCEEEITFQNFEVVLENSENEEESKSPSTSPTLSASSSEEQLELYNSIVFCIFAILGLFLYCSFKEKNPTNPITSSKRKLEEDSFSNDIKKARMDLKVFHSYSKTPEKFSHQLKRVTLKKEAFREKLKASKKRVKNLSRKVSSMNQVLAHLKRKRILDSEALNVLEKSYSGIPLALLKRALTCDKSKKKGKKQSREQFPPELRSFALTLQFYSSKAYNYVRNCFSLALPNPSTIRSWIRNIDCEPGFSDCSFLTLERTVKENLMNNKNTVCALMLDEMSIKKQIEVRNSKVWGYENFGTGIVNDALKCATESLTLMVVAINGSWKIPIAYFLISSLGGSAKANIVREAIKRLNLIGIRVASVTCDGPSAHFTMAEELGADIHDINNLKPYFENSDSSRTFIIFDAAHMLKLVRNNWGNLGIFIDQHGHEVDFQYITKLAKVQEEEFCRLGTKLRKAHMQWRSQKMKVNLAAQTLSRSVSDALEFLLEVHPDFKNARPTIEFIRIVDELFDLANSRNPFGRGTKSPLQQANEEFWKPKIMEGIDYLKSLKNAQGQLLSTTRNKTPIRGLCITLLSLVGLYDDLVNRQNSPLRYLMTYKFSQDHLELFFCCVRGRNGWNNNPTAYQFYYTYRRLALNMDIKSFTGNCAVLDDTHILGTSSKKKIMPSLTTDDMAIIKKYNLDINDMSIDEDEIRGIINILPKLSSISENVVAYVAGFVTKSLIKTIKCPECLEFLRPTENNFSENLKLFEIKNRGGLIAPKNDVINVCLYIEKKIRQTLIINNNFLPKENNFINIFNVELSMFLFENNYLSELDDHLFSCSFGEVSHRMKIIQLICRMFTKIRFFNVAKEQSLNIKGTPIRTKYSKLILFHHQ